MNKTSKKNSTNTTTRKVKVIGTQQYVNKNTGELEDFQVIRIEDRDFNFTKVWMTQIISSLNLLGNKKMQVAFWIMNHIDYENKLCYTQRQIADMSGLSLATVHITLKALLDANFLRKYNTGVYIINPDILFKGTHGKRLNVVLQYKKLDPETQELEAAKKKLVELYEDTTTGKVAEQTDIYDYIEQPKK